MAIVSLRPENIIPFITTEYAFILQPSTQDTFTLNGVNFKPGTILTIPGFDGTIDTVTIVSPTELEFTITSGPAVAVYDIVLANRANNTEWGGNGVNLLSVEVSNWWDLRQNGDAFTHGNAPGNDIRYRNGMSLSRDSDGMWFTGANPWTSWVKFESLWWPRGELRMLEWVFNAPTASIMIGIGSDATNEAATSQYNQMENQAYFSSAAYFSSLYGNNGTPGTTGYQSNGLNLAPHAFFKIKFTLDGRAANPTPPGGVFTLYSIPSIAPTHWSDENTPLLSFTIAGTLAPDEAHIMPSLLPRDGGAQRFAALRIT